MVLDEGAALVRPAGLDRPGRRRGRQLHRAPPHRAGARQQRRGPLVVALGPGVGRLAPAVGHHLDVECAGRDPQGVGVARAVERGGLGGQRGQRGPDAREVRLQRARRGGRRVVPQQGGQLVERHGLGRPQGEQGQHLTGPPLEAAGRTTRPHELDRTEHADPHAASLRAPRPGRSDVGATMAG